MVRQQTLLLVAALFWAMLQLTTIAEEQEVSLSGKVDVAGVLPADLRLAIQHGNDYLAIFPPDAAGRFSVKCKVPRSDAPLLVVPYQPNLLDGKKRQVLIGYAKMAARSADDISVRLELVPIRQVRVAALAPDKKPLRNVVVTCVAKVPLGDEKDAPRSCEVWKTTTSDAGELVINVVDKPIGEYELFMLTSMPNHDEFRGRLQIAGQNLPPLEKPLEWVLEHNQVTLVVKVIWDPDFSAKPFVPDNKKGFLHALGIVGVANSESAMDEAGMVRFGNTKPGHYKLAVSFGGENEYEITGGTEKVEIADGGAVPAVHTVTIRPKVRPLTPTLP